MCRGKRGGPGWPVAWRKDEARVSLERITCCAHAQRPIRPRLMGWNRGSRTGSHAGPVSDCRRFDLNIDMVGITAKALCVVCDPAGQWSMHLKRFLTREGEVP